MPDRIQMRDLNTDELKKLIEEEAKSPLGVVLPFHYEYPDSKVVELVPIAVEAIKKQHKDSDVAIGAYTDVIWVHPIKRPSQARKAPLTLYRNIHSVCFYIYDSGLWINARSHPWALRLLREAKIITVMPRFEAVMKDSWGGYGYECGGAYYEFRILKNDSIIAEGEASYSACIPGCEAGFAYTEVRMVAERLLVDEVVLQP